MAETKGNTRSSRRIEELAKPKRVPEEFLEDRCSVYWIDHKPLKSGPDGTTKIDVTPRVAELSKSREAHSNYEYDRPTPIWEVKPSALKATASARIERLAKHTIYDSYKMHRSSIISVSDGAKGATASAHIERLAIPKKKIDIYDPKEERWGQTQPVSESAMKAQASERVETLAECKPYHPKFQHAKQVQWGVTDNALNALASLRIQQLSRPHSRTLIKDNYDPYEVSRGARKAKATARVEELALPIPRKDQAKKVVA